MRPVPGWWSVSRRRWDRGTVVVRREVLGLELGALPVRPRPGRGVWFGYPVHIVEDHDDALVSSVGPGAEFGFVGGVWPTATGEHPWRSRARWEGHGCLMVQRPGECSRSGTTGMGRTAGSCAGTSTSRHRSIARRSATTLRTSSWTCSCSPTAAGPSRIARSSPTAWPRVSCRKASSTGLYSSAKRSARNSTAGSCDGISAGRSGLRRQRGEMLTFPLSGT